MSRYISEWEAGQRQLPHLQHICLVSGPAAKVDDYLPRAWSVLGTFGYNACYIGGFDDAGWTLDDYVEPRLASGLYVCTELVPKEKP